ncbi:Protein FLX-like 3 [Vitis vinifera]|uniref:Protein FLX-like 3 n=1 Tax=Vitis vinifera TaxID=29760 RepID=A0A438ED87_VITVI|nr:Protein FLX-like 3 [Vitis vinifera]
MAGRNRMPRNPNGFRGFRDGPPNPDGFRGFRDGPPPVLNRGPGPLPLHPVAMEEELELQHRELQRIVAENRHVIDDNTMLQSELAAAKDDIHRLGQIIPKLRADREVQARELIDRGLKLEADLRAVEPLRTEGLTQDVARLQAENQQLIAMRADIDRMRKELAEASAFLCINWIGYTICRRAFEYEKKANEEQLEQKQAMEKNLISMAREIEKLRADQLNQIGEQGD